MGIPKTVEVELFWLKCKRRYYSDIKAEDEASVAMLERRPGSGVA